MEIIKRKASDKKVSRDGPLYIKRFGGTIAIPSIARDFILPHRYIRVNVTDDLVVLTPTNDENFYKLSISKDGQTRVAWRYANTFCPLPEKIEIPLTLNEDGTLSFNRPSNRRLSHAE